MQVRLFSVPEKLSSLELRDAAQFYGQLLMHKNLLKNIQLRVAFTRTEGNTTMWEDDNVRPREFTITIERGMSARNTLITLAHEMVHLKQYATGELRDYMSCARVHRWRDQKRDWGDVEYWDLPWEIEAYGRERGLYLRFVEHVKAQKFIDSLKKSA